MTPTSRQAGRTAPEADAAAPTAPPDPAPRPEPAPVAPARGAGGDGSILGRHALTGLLVVLVAVFAILLPGTFLVPDNIAAVLSTQSVAAFVALAVLVPMVCNCFDLSVGYALGFSCICTVGLQSELGFPWPLAVLTALLGGAILGAVNGTLVRGLQINSFIATLGTGSVVYALGLWFTGGQALVGSLPEGFGRLGGVVGGIPLAAVYVVVVAAVIWVVLEYTRGGRQLYIIGSSEKTAALLAVPVHRYVVLSFVTSGVLAAAAGTILASQLQTAQSATGPEYLLPAFAAVFLGSTAIRPGRVNVWGTVLAVLVLATLISGLQQFGFAAWAQPFVNGLMVIGAVGASGVVQRWRASRQAR